VAGRLAGNFTLRKPGSAVRFRRSVTSSRPSCHFLAELPDAAVKARFNGLPDLCSSRRISVHNGQGHTCFHAITLSQTMGLRLPSLPEQ
jgi:hypothetical protein